MRFASVKIIEDLANQINTAILRKQRTITLSPDPDIVRALTEGSAAVDAMRWIPINRACQDGRHYLVKPRVGGVVQAAYSSRRGGWFTLAGEQINEPLAWCDVLRALDRQEIVK